MKVAIDKSVINKITNIKQYEYIYIFEDESLDYLLNLGILCVNKDYIDFDVDINLTKYDIECIKKANIEDKEWFVITPIINHKIAIIIPNYNYEKWIDKCLTSIAKQTYKNYEVIFCDDCSTDNSVNIAYNYVEKLPNIKIIQLKQKRLNGGARNEAYLHLSNDVEYIWYVDSDDYLKDEYVLENINKKLRNKPDVLFVGMDMHKNGKQSLYDIPEYKDRYEAMKGWSGSCGKVIKKELATRQECLYNEGTLQEDRNQHYKICIYMKSFEILKKSVYVWNRENQKSTTKVRNKATWGTSAIRNYADVLQLYLTVKGRDRKIDEILEERVESNKNQVINGGDAQL